MSSENNFTESPIQYSYKVPFSFSTQFIQAMGKIHNRYPNEIFSILGIASKNFDIVRFTDEFFSNSASNVADTSVDDNANVSERSIPHYITESTKAIHKLNSIYVLYEKIRELNSTKVADLWLEKLVSGEIFVNDLINTYTSYCFAFDLRTLVNEGLSFFKGNMKIVAPKRTESFLSQVEQAIAYISNQITGAASMPDFFVALDWFLRKDFGEDYASKLDLAKSRDLKETASYNVRNHLQRFIYSMNFPFRGGGQSAFTNVSVMDRGFLKSLFTAEGMSGSDYMYPDFTTIQIESVLKLSKFFLDVYSDMNGTEGYFTFPVTTIALSISEDSDTSDVISKSLLDPKDVERLASKGKHLLDEETFLWAAEHNRVKSLANIFLSKATSFSSCCRLKNDFSQLNSLGYQNSFGVGGVNIGSHRVMGLNLPRIALLQRDNPDELDIALDLVHKGLYAHRLMVEDNIKKGILPLYRYKWLFLEKQFSTVGFVGHREYLLNKGLDPKSDEGIEAGLEVLKHIESKMLEWQSDPKEQEHHCVYNLEQIPAESQAVKLCKIDTLLGYNPHNYELYSNQYLSLYDSESIYDRFRIQGKYDSVTSGGAILHISHDDKEPLTARQYAKVMIEAVYSGTQYYAFNRVFAKCNKCGKLFTNKSECPDCHSMDIEYYTRVIGYLSKISSWNQTRREKDFPKRYLYKNEQIVQNI